MEGITSSNEPSPKYAGADADSPTAQAFNITADMITTQGVIRMFVIHGIIENADLSKGRDIYVLLPESDVNVSQ
jgi:hypothetical protein